ncbi:CYC2-like cyclin 6 [Perkinsela sp. CCAP 1560/4]|nr:CYC2-like cyclin 6 [Perkinsela sp. CCAP 1560/4]|eukprot:KNH08561.1 CYC2-like cyclin 6 [Perkinsela sp. CCAP 1560/4]
MESHPVPLRTPFHSCRIPPISVPDYIQRIRKYSKCSSECFIIGLIYVDRFSRATGVVLTYFNVYRMILIAVMIAAKFRDDVYFSNGYYGSIGGIPREEVNTLEVQFLTAIGWNMWVEPKAYWKHLESLCHPALSR